MSAWASKTRRRGPAPAGLAVGPDLDVIRQAVEAPAAKAPGQVLVLAIDPGLQTAGYALLLCDRRRCERVGSGVITTDKDDPEAARLVELAACIDALLDEQDAAFGGVDELAIETLVAGNNAPTVVQVAQARGLFVVAAGKRGIPVAGYAAGTVKKQLTGDGRAEKPEVRRAVKERFPDAQSGRDDEFDALAIGVTHWEHTIEGIR